MRVVVSRVESNTLFIAPNLCLRLRTQIGLKLGSRVSKGNNFVAVKETFLFCPRLSYRLDHPNN